MLTLNIYIVPFRAVGRSANPGLPVLFGGHNQPPLVEIGLTDLPKSGGASPATPAPTGLYGDTKTDDSGRARRARPVAQLAPTLR